MPRAVEIVERGYAAFQNGGVEALRPYCAPELVVYPFPEWMEEPEYHGFEGFRELIRGWTEGFDGFLPETEEFREAGDGSVVWLGWNTGRIRGTSNPIRQPLGAIYRLGGEQFTEIRFFMTWQETLDAAGLSEPAG